MICVIVCLVESISYALKLSRLVATVISQEWQGRGIAIVAVPDQIRRWILSRFDQEKQERCPESWEPGLGLGNDGIMPTGSLLAIFWGAPLSTPPRGLTIALP